MTFGLGWSMEKPREEHFMMSCVDGEGSQSDCTMLQGEYRG